MLKALHEILPAGKHYDADTNKFETVKKNMLPSEIFIDKQKSILKYFRENTKKNGKRNANVVCILQTSLIIDVRT